MADDIQDTNIQTEEQVVEDIQTETPEVIGDSEVKGDAEERSQASTAVSETNEDAPETPEQQDPKPVKKEVNVSKNLSEIIEKIEKLSVLELADLVHALEDKFGVTAAAPVAAAAANGAASSSEPVEEQTTFNVVLTSAGANKIGAIKAVREIVPTLGLKEAKDLVEAAPKPVLEGVNKQTADEAKQKLTAAGATVELK